MVALTEVGVFSYLVVQNDGLGQTNLSGLCDGPLDRLEPGLAVLGVGVDDRDVVPVEALQQLDDRQSLKAKSFLIKSELIESVLAPLSTTRHSFFLFLFNTQLEMHLREEPD